MIDLSQLSIPAVVEPLDYESILAEILAYLHTRDVDLSIDEHDPAYKILEVAAYRELLLRQRINNAAKAVMLPYATGTDLDNLAAFYFVERLMVDPGDPNANPPIDPTYETDARLRDRVLIAFDQYSTAGSADSYRYHALSASTKVKDVGVHSPEPGAVHVTILSTDGNGTPDADLITTVDNALSAETVRPLTDYVLVQAASVIEYSVTAVLYVYPGPSSALVLQVAEVALADLVESNHKLGHNIHASAIYGALQVEGVQRAELSGWTDLVIDADQAAYCTGITITVGGQDV